MSALPGSVVWLALAAALASWAILAGTVLRRRVPTLGDVVRWWLESWVGRLVLLALWAEAGFHVLTQRP